MLIGRAIIISASAMLSTLLVLGHFDPWVLLAFTFLIGCGGALNDPAWQASVGDMLPRAELPAAVTLISVGFNTVRSVGPALGGIVVASFGPLTAFVLATLGYFAPLVAILRSKWNTRSSSLPREAMTTAIYDGLRFTAMSSEIKGVIARGMFFGLAGSSTLSLLPLVVRDHLRGGPLAYGSMMAGFGIGAFLCGVLSGALRRKMSQESLVKVACCACAVCAFSLAWTTSLTIAATSLALGGAGWVLAWSSLGASVQLASPRWIVGRTISLYSALTNGGIAAGSWIWGVTAQAHSPSGALEISGLSLLLVAALGLLLPVRQRTESAPDPLGKFDSPPVALDLKPRSGPIVVKIEYRIPETNLDSFLPLMRERRRVVCRVGARHWSLLRDLEEPSHWTETFRTPTWTDYVRLNHRLTTVDKELDERVCQLHMGDGPPHTTLAIERPTESARKSDVLTPVSPLR
jgi:predicted MFS family arabinose efflux permease